MLKSRLPLPPHLTYVICILFLPVNLANGDLIVRDVHSTGTIDSLADADSLIAGNGIDSESTIITTFIDYRDGEGGGGPGNYNNDFAFPNNNIGSDDNDFAIHASGRVFIPSSGLWTFGVNSDDGSRLRIGGNDVIVDDTLHAPANFFGTTSLASGWHDLDFVFFERGGGATVELFAAQGTFTSFDANEFRLVGDTVNGGLLTAIPEPGTAGVIGVAIVLICIHRRR